MSKSVSTRQQPSFAPLAIIGIGGLFPQAGDLASFWSNIRNGRDAISEVPLTHWSPDDYWNADPATPDKTYGRFGGFLSPVEFNPLEFGILPNALEAIDSSQLLALIAAREALLHAGYGPGREFDRRRVSTILGVTGATEMVIPLGARLGRPIWQRGMLAAGIDPQTAADAVERIAEQYVGWQENSFPGLLGNVTAGRISRHFDFGGTNCVVDAACGSSLSALHLAALELETGRADMVVTGGVDTFNDIFMYTCFSKTPALSPGGHSRPFDADGDGTTLGEGVGLLVLKRLADAERDGDRVLAVLKGLGTSSDGKGEAIYAPNADGQIAALREAYRLAGVTPDTIGLVEAHGTGTRVGDAVEVRALRQVFGEADQPWCALGSIKSQIGHAKAAAGAAGLIKATLALYYKVLPPSLKVKKPLPAVQEGRSPFYLSTEARPWTAHPAHPRRAAVSAFGFGGSNYHAVLEEHRAERTEIDWDEAVQIFAWSGDSPQALLAQLNGLPAATAWPQWREAARSSRREFRVEAPCRLLLVAEAPGTNLPAQLAAARQLLQRDDTPSCGENAEGLFWSWCRGEKKVAFLFPGQGAQYPNMLRDLALRFPQLQRVLDRAQRLLAPELDLAEALYPPPGFDPQRHERQRQRLTATDVAQPALGTVSLGALRVLEAFGATPDAVAGHSFGELTALCAAGALGEDALIRLARLRGRLMAAGSGDRGGMLAVLAPLERIDALLGTHKLNLTLANRNAPEQGVLSGTLAEIERAETLCREQGLRCQRLEVAAAFHSELVAGAREPFLQELRRAGFRSPQLPVQANSLGREYPADTQKAIEVLAGQLARPVDFVRNIETLHQAGIRCYIEVGPGGRLGGLVRSILADKPHRYAALDAANGRGNSMVALARTLALLASLGRPIRLDLWDPATESSPARKGMTVAICGANYRAPWTPKAPAAKRQTVTETEPRVLSQPSPAPVPTPVAAETNNATLLALQQLQQQTAQLHQQFLSNQQSMVLALQQLLHQPLVGAQVFQSPPAILQSAPVPVAVAVSATPPVPVPVVTVGPAPPVPAADDSIRQTLLEVIAEKTGYPVEMLEPEMALEADLGIDSIKRVEILSALQERLPQAPVIGPAQLGTLQTLQQIAAYLGAGATVAAATALLAAAAPATEITATLLAVIAEKTGYPVEMLEPEMALEADLGIDSIKRVEILSALQERLPQAPVIGPAQLGTLQTLQQIAAYLGAGATVAATTAPLAAAAPGTDITATLLAVIAEKTGYPVEMLEPEMALEADLGIDSIKRVEILSALQERLPQAPVIGPAQLGTLQTLQQIAAYLGAGTATAAAVPAVPPAAPVAAMAVETAPLLCEQVVAVPLGEETHRSALAPSADLELWVTSDGSPLAGALAVALQQKGQSVRLIDLYAADTLEWPERLRGLILLPPAVPGNGSWAWAAFRLVQAAAPSLRRAGAAGDALLLTVSRLDGAFGFDATVEPQDPGSGSLAGLTKTAAIEWPEVRCKALDLAPALSASLAAASIAEEAFIAGPVEVGLSPRGKVQLQRREHTTGTTQASPVQPGQLVVITGGGRGVTAAVAQVLARAWQPTLLLLGRSPLPATEPAELAGISDEAALRKALLQRAGRKLSPKELAGACQQVLQERELRDTLDQLRQTGAQVLYRPVNVRDGGAVQRLLAEVQQDFGPVRGLVHGAGVLADRLIEDKTAEQFDGVYGTKVTGLKQLLSALDPAQLRFMALFSSSTARFGRKGQSDYAMANETLNKLAQQFSRKYPQCRALSINWGPWDGGMVTPALKQLFAEEGIGVIGLQAGAELLLRELSQPAGPVELVVLGRLETAAAAERTAEALPLPEQEPVLELDLDIAQFPFLASHVVGGKAVLPMAMMVEWLAHAALHSHPGYLFSGFDGLQVLAGIKLAERDRLHLQIYAGRPEQQGGQLRVPVELLSQGDGPRRRHARATILLAGSRPERRPRGERLTLPPFHGKVYDGERLFHGRALQGIEQVEGCAAAGISARVRSAPKPGDWIRHPLRARWLTDPLALDSSFQMMILWSQERRGAASLPHFAGHYRQYVERFPEGGVEVAIRITDDRDSRARADIEFIDPANGLLVAALEGYECTIDASLIQAFRSNRLAPAADGAVEGVA